MLTKTEGVHGLLRGPVADPRLVRRLESRHHIRWGIIECHS